MKYKVGDWVQLVDHRGDLWNPEGDMDEYIGKEVIITEITRTRLRFKEERGWWFHPDDIAGYAKNKIVTDILRDL